MERRRLGEREAKILRELTEINKRVEHDKVKKGKEHQTLPLIALVRPQSND